MVWWFILRVYHMNYWTYPIELEIVDRIGQPDFRKSQLAKSPTCSQTKKAMSRLVILHKSRTGLFSPFFIGSFEMNGQFSSIFHGYAAIYGHAIVPERIPAVPAVPARAPLFTMPWSVVVFLGAKEAKGSRTRSYLEFPKHLIVKISSTIM